MTGVLPPRTMFSNCGALRRLGNGLQILQSLRRLDEGHVGAGFDIALSALDRRLEALNRAGVRSGDDDHPLAARVDRGPHLADHLVGRN